MSGDRTQDEVISQRDARTGTIDALWDEVLAARRARDDVREERDQARADLATMRDHLEALRLASRAPLHEPLVDAVAGLAAVFDEHTRVRDLLGVRPGDDPVEAAERLMEEIEGLREPLRATIADREQTIARRVEQADAIARERDEARVEVKRLTAALADAHTALSLAEVMDEFNEPDTQEVRREAAYSVMLERAEAEVARLRKLADGGEEIVRRQRDLLHEENERLRAVIAEPDEPALLNLHDVYERAFVAMIERPGGTREAQLAGIRALLADQRRRAGGGA